MTKTHRLVIFLATVFAVTACARTRALAADHDNGGFRYLFVDEQVDGGWYVDADLSRLTCRDCPVSFSDNNVDLSDRTQDQASAVTQGTDIAPAVAEITAPPALTTEQKHALQLAFKEVKFWEVSEQLAASEKQRALMLFQQLVAAWTPAGYRLNDQLQLEKLPEPKKEPGTQ